MLSASDISIVVVFDNLPKSFQKDFRDKVRLSGAKVLEVSDQREICDGVWSTGEAGSEIIESLKKLGVRRVGPSHCSGDRTRQLLQKEFGKDFIQIGAGASVRGDL